MAGRMEASPAIRSSSGLERNGSSPTASVPARTTPRFERLAQPVELPPPPRLRAETIAGLAAAAGVAAIALGAWAFVSSVRSESAGAGARSLSTAEQILPLLARPSTERVPFSGSAGQITLVVGIGGRGVLVPDGLEAAAPGWSYQAWIVEPNAAASVSAALFSGTEAAVPLSAPVPRGATVGITIEPADGAPALSGTPKLLARRSP